MNVESIEKGEVRIFPFYKDIYLGNSPIGYSNKKSAQKYMNKMPKDDVFKDYFGSQEEYERTHSYWCKLSDTLYGDDIYRRYGIKIYNPLYHYPENRVCSKDMSDEEYKEIKELSEKLDHMVKDKDAWTEIKKFQEKYGMDIYRHIDYDDEYTNAYWETYDKYVRFKEGVLDISVKWTDGSVTKAPGM